MITATRLPTGQNCRQEEVFGLFDAESEIKHSPFPARRQLRREYRPTMHNVSSYVLKTHFMDYGLSRVKSLWIDEEITNEYQHGTPDQPLFASQTLVHNCRICRGENNFDTNNESFFSSDSPVNVHYDSELSTGTGSINEQQQQQHLQEQIGVADQTPQPLDTGTVSRRNSNPFWEDSSSTADLEQDATPSTVSFKRSNPFEDQTNDYAEGTTSIALDDFIGTADNTTFDTETNESTAEDTLKNLYKYCGNTRESEDFVNTLVADIEKDDSDKENTAHNTYTPSQKRVCLDNNRDLDSATSSSQFVLMQLATEVTDTNPTEQSDTSLGVDVTSNNMDDTNNMRSSLNDDVVMSDVSDLSESELVTPESNDEDKVVLSPPSPRTIALQQEQSDMNGMIGATLVDSLPVSALAMVLNSASKSGASIGEEPSEANSENESEAESVESGNDSESDEKSTEGGSELTQVVLTV